jgi:hypothetical protein
MHYKVYDVLYSQYSHQNVAAAIVAIVSVMLLLRQYKVQTWITVLRLFYNN